MDLLIVSYLISQISNNCLYLSAVQSVGGLQYTDIDYYVFSDGADKVLHGKSPYLQSVYRYPPLFAMIHTLNKIFHLPEMGKILFSILDVLVGAEIYNLIEFKRVQDYPSFGDDKFHSNGNYARFWSWLWMINPISVLISTRGSAGLN